MSQPESSLKYNVHDVFVTLSPDRAADWRSRGIAVAGRARIQPAASLSAVSRQLPAARRSEELKVADNLQCTFQFIPSIISSFISLSFLPY